MKRFFIASLIVLTAFSASTAMAGGRKGVQPPPRLFEPSDDTDLTGKDELLFRWGTEGDRSMITEYQFKLYKGAETVESGLMKSETIAARHDHIKLPASLFEDGQTYAWQIRGTGSAKTRPAYAVFKVNKG